MERKTCVKWSFKMCFCGRDCSHIQSKTWDKSTYHRTLAQKQNKQSRTKAGVKAHTVKLCAFVLERVRAWWKGSRSTVDGQRLSNRKDVFLNSEFFFFFYKNFSFKGTFGKFHFFQNSKIHFLFCQCRLSTVNLDDTALFLVDVDQTALFQPVDSRQCRRLSTCRCLSTSILQAISSRPSVTRSLI